MITAAVIDDDKYTVEVFAEYLEISGVKVIATGYDGKAAVEIYKKFKPDITFLDLAMEEYDGIYALEKIREIDPRSQIVIITADLDLRNSEKLEALKPTEIFIKPFDMENVHNIIKKITDRNTISEEKKALVSFTIAHALAKMSPHATNEVGIRLYSKYQCYFVDCLEHPEYLKDILAEIFGSGAKIVTDEIKKNLAEFENQYPIPDFLAALSE